MFDMLQFSHVGSVLATGCEKEGDIKKNFRERAGKLAESIA